MGTKTEAQVQATAKGKGASKAAAVSYSALDNLAEYGGFAFLENIIDGFSNLNPKRKARRNIFLEDVEWDNQRDELENRLNIWLNLLEKNDDIAKMHDVSVEKAGIAEETLNKNLKKALETTAPMEQSYRAIALFYENTESEKVKNVTIVNSSLEQLCDLDNPLFIDYIHREIKQNYDRLDLRKNYGILVIPGHLKNNAILEKWSKIAHKSKVMLVTDFKDLGSPDDVVDIFSNADHAGGDTFRANVIMTCNWLMGREKVEAVGEEEDLFVPPSGALAGKIYNTLMSQVAAGKKFGGMNGVTGVRFDLKRSEISQIESMGLVPMVNEYSKVMAFSAKTLFNGDNLGLQTYSVVRVFDHVTKVLFDFLNRRAFENWTTRTEADLRSQIVKFLDGIQGPRNLIEKFKVLRIEQDPKQKDRILLDIHMTPFFPAKSFVIKLDGHKGDGPNPDWRSEYEQA